MSARIINRERAYHLYMAMYISMYISLIRVCTPRCTPAHRLTAMHSPLNRKSTEVLHAKQLTANRPVPRRSEGRHSSPAQSRVSPAVERPHCGTKGAAHNDLRC